MRISRADKSLFAEWWFTFDRLLLGAMLALVAIGLVLVLAASPAAAVKRGLPAFHFVERHALLAPIGVGAMLAISLLDARAIRRLALVLYLASVGALALVLLHGEELNGARRFLRVAGLSIQPAELVKPALVVLAAWALAESRRRQDVPALLLACLLLAVPLVLMAMQPDVGQAAIVAAVWIGLLLLTVRGGWLGLGLIGVAAGTLAAAYALMPQVRLGAGRLVALAPAESAQTGRALQSFAEGGLLGRGPGEGMIKTVLSDAHTDFMLAVLAEEYGALACLGLIALYGFVVLRALARMVGCSDAFTRLAVTGLALLIGLPVLLNVALNVGLLPARGLGLPFVAVGGSALIAASITGGMLLALTRRRPDDMRLKMPGLASNAAARTG